jgi:hypothetical protein
MVFHILAPMPRKAGAGNRYYRPSDLRIKKTLCGQPRTSHDIRFGWQALPCGRFEPCKRCCQLRSTSERMPPSPRQTRS